jgi:hypothetical protein
MSAERSHQSYARVQDICLCNTHDTVSNQLQKFLSKQNLLLDDISLVLSGDNGDIRYAPAMAALFESVPEDKLLRYKIFWNGFCCKCNQTSTTSARLECCIGRLSGRFHSVAQSL